MTTVWRPLGLVIFSRSVSNTNQIRNNSNCKTVCLTSCLRFSGLYSDPTHDGSLIFAWLSPILSSLFPPSINRIVLVTRQNLEIVEITQKGRQDDLTSKGIICISKICSKSVILLQRPQFNNQVNLLRVFKVWILCPQKNCQAIFCCFKLWNSERIFPFPLDMYLPLLVGRNCCLMAA